jgi:hypothetical protein
MSKVWAAATPGKMAGAAAMKSPIASHADILVTRFMVISSSSIFEAALLLFFLEFPLGLCDGFLRDSYFPTRIVESSPISPKTLRSHKTTTMITTAFKIDLMDPAIGI